jgi:primase-polymerase (primpol)-like protein
MDSTSSDGLAQSLSRDSTVCRGFDLESLPEALKGHHQWVVWKRVERDGKETKVPYNARSGKPARVTDPKTWSSF